MKIVVTGRDGAVQDLDFEEGARLMHVLRDANMGIRAECDGNCACATCHVYIDEAWMERLSPLEEEEEDMLDEACEPEDNSRLSCQVVLSAAHDGLPLTIAKDWE